MPRAPKLASFPAIRGALRFYQVCSIITGTMLLLLVAEMIGKYALGYELFLGGSGGFLWFAPVVETASGLESTGDGFNLGRKVSVMLGGGPDHKNQMMRIDGRKLTALHSAGNNR